MKYKVNKKRIIILGILMILEVSFISLAIRSYGNKDRDVPVIYVDNNEIKQEHGWAGSEYVLKSDSGCVNKSGKRINTHLRYNGDVDKIVMEFDKSTSCFVYFSKE